MKSIISAILLLTVIKANRLLQAIESSTCAAVRCGLGGPCYDNPYTNTPICCPADDTCAYPQDYIDQPIAICADGNEYPSKCHGYCSGQKASECNSICECETSEDCANGYECLETPFGFAGCNEKYGNSCFGFCVVVGESCGGYVGLALCKDNELCFPTTNYPNGNNIGYCGSLPSDCAVSPGNPSCGGFENCATYFDGCNDCDCGVDATGFPPRCTEIACSPDEYKPAYCTGCREGYVLDKTTGKCIIPSCGGIPYCQSYKPDACNICGCSDVSSDLARCTFAFCGPQDPANFECTNCIDGYQLNANKECEKCDIVFCYAAPCDVTTCPAYPDATCENNYCGGCNAIFTDSNGKILTADDCTIDMITCVNVDCFDGENCYDMEEGPVCCDPKICEGGFCGGIGGIQCEKGYECVDDPSNPCDPKTTTDCGGICVNPDAQLTTDCGGFDNCVAYNDGCNDCVCSDSGLDGCTKIFCPPDSITKPYCTACEDGYILNDANECVVGRVICGGFENCASYNDGCNDCICSDSGFDGCTKKLCPPDSITKPYCTGCEDGYTLNDANECVVDRVICGGFENCASYNDGCNNCICSDSGIDGCTRKFCPPDSVTKPFCTSCKPGYRLNEATGECEGCNCIALFDPVCCDGKTYSNSCVAGCQQATGTCSDGACSTCASLTCPVGSRCCHDGAGGVQCCPGRFKRRGRKYEYYEYDSRYDHYKRGYDNDYDEYRGYDYDYGYDGYYGGYQYHPYFRNKYYKQKRNGRRLNKYRE